MSEHDDNLDRWIHRVVTAAGSDAPADNTSAQRSVSVPGRRWPVAVAAAVLAVLGIGGIVWTARSDTSSTGPSPTASSSPPPASVAPSSTLSGATVASGAATTEPTDELKRPTFDVEWCRPTSTRTRDLVFEGAYIWVRQNGLAVQLFVPAGGDVTGRFAVALRIMSNPRFDADTANTEVNGQPARATFATPTWGELLWSLPDGTEAYLRTSTMTSDELIALAEVLEPRDSTDALPAFDTTSTAYEVVNEALTPITINGIVETACETQDGGWMTATVIEGSLAQALFLTDRPAISLALRSLDGGRLLVVTGSEDIADRSQEALDSVRAATDDEWATLTTSALDTANPATPIDDIPTRVTQPS